MTPRSGWERDESISSLAASTMFPANYTRRMGRRALSSKDVDVQVESGAVPSSVPPGARFCGPESEAEESGAARVRLSDLMRRAHP